MLENPYHHCLWATSGPPHKSHLSFGVNLLKQGNILYDGIFNPNITGMTSLLNSTGICVLFVTQFCVAFLLRKVGMPVQLVVLCRCTRGGGEPGYCVHCIHLYTKLFGQRGLLFQKRNNEGFGFEDGNIKRVGK